MAFSYTFRAQGLAHPAIEDIYDDPALHNEIDTPEYLDMEPSHEPTSAKSLKIKQV